VPATRKQKPPRGPQPTHKLLTLNLERAAVERLERMANQRGETPAEYVEHVLQPLLEAENGDALFWFLIALNSADHMLIAKHCRKRGWQVDQLLDVLIGDALTNLNI
jgi:hypothetical protein